MLVRSGIAMLSRGRQRHVYPLSPDATEVLLFPAFQLCILELGGGKTSLLAVLHAQVFLLGFVLPCAILIQRTHRQKDMRVRIVSVCIVDSYVCTHTVCSKLLRDVRTRERNLFIMFQLNGQRNNDLPRKPAVLRLLGRLNSVP